MVKSRWVLLAELLVANAGWRRWQRRAFLLADRCGRPSRSIGPPRTSLQAAVSSTAPAPRRDTDFPARDREVLVSARVTAESQAVPATASTSLLPTDSRGRWFPTYQLPALNLKVSHRRIAVTIFGPRPFEDMDRDDRLRASACRS